MKNIILKVLNKALKLIEIAIQQAQSVNVEAKQIRILTAVAAVVILSGAIQSCMQEDFMETNLEISSMSAYKSVEQEALAPDEFLYFGKVIKCRDGELIWQRQLELIIENNDRIEKNNLSLINYKYLGKINSIAELEKIKLDIVNNAVFPIYHSPDSFELGNIEDIAPEYIKKEVLDKLIINSKHSIATSTLANRKSNYSQYFFEAGTMSAIKLEWMYKDEILNTIAIVSDKNGIIYDNLLYFVHFVFVKEDSEKSKIDVSEPSPRLKSGNEHPEDGWGKYQFTKWELGINVFGGVLWEYDIRVSVPWTRENGIVSITSFSIDRAFSSGNFGWNCEADARSISIQTGAYGHAHFAWAWAYRYLLSVVITWNGVTFTFSGGGTSDKGEVYFTGY